jgi:hypothetical protein
MSAAVFDRDAVFVYRTASIQKANGVRRLMMAWR